jgi:hypothetical protein
VSDKLENGTYQLTVEWKTIPKVGRHMPRSFKAVVERTGEGVFGLRVVDDSLDGCGVKPEGWIDPKREIRLGAPFAESETGEVDGPWRRTGEPFARGTVTGWELLSAHNSRSQLPESEG